MRKFWKIKWQICLIAAVLCLLLPSAAWATTLRVCLSTTATDSEFTVIKGEYTIQGGNLKADTITWAEEDDIVRVIKGASGFTVYLNGQKVGTSSQNLSLLADDEGIIGYGGKQYRGSFSLLTNGYVLNMVDIEDYLYGVVGEEIGYNAPDEALRAQAIVARSYAAFNMGGTYYDVLSTTASQVYGGYSAEQAHDSSAVRDAVDDTADLVMYYDGDLVEAVFCSSAGGYTENNENVWGGNAVPYLRAVKSRYDKNYANYEWTVKYTPTQLKNLAESYMIRIKQSGSFGTYVRLELSYKAADGNDTESGRVTKATIYGTEGKVTAERDAVRTMLGLKSTLFEVSGASENGEYTEPLDEVYVLNATGDLEKREWQDLYVVNGENAAAKRVDDTLADLTEAYLRSSAGLISFSGAAVPTVGISGEGVVITGHGYGHGVGMSQYGAIGMAKDGYIAEEILAHYYGGEDEDLLEIDYWE